MANQHISFRDPDFFQNCSHPHSHCYPVPVFGHSPVCEQDPNQDFAFLKARPVFNEFPDTVSNYTRRCSVALHSIPFEMIQADDKRRQFLAVISNDAFFLFDVATEQILIQTQFSKEHMGLFNKAKVISMGNSGQRAFIVGIGGTKISELVIELQGGVALLPSGLISHDLQATIFDLETFFNRPDSSSWAVAITGPLNAVAPTRLRFFRLTGNSGIEFRNNDLEYTLNNVPTSAFYRLYAFRHINYDRGVALPTSMACFPAKNERMLILFYTQSQVYIFAHYAQTTGVTGTVNLDVNNAKGKNLYWLADNTVQLTSAAAFGECFGDLSTVAQQVWLVLGVQTIATGASSVRMIPLPEFARVDFTCAKEESVSSWRLPSAYSAQWCKEPIEKVCPGAPNEFSQSADDSKTLTCLVRLSVPEKVVTSPVNNLIVKLHSANSGTPAPTDVTFSFIQHIFALQALKLDIFSFQELACVTTSSVNAPKIDTLQSITFPDYVRQLHVSENSQHFFASVYKREWELYVQQRLVEICSVINANATTQAALAKFQTQCQQSVPRPLSIYDFIKYYSACNNKWYCPYFGNVRTQNHDVAVNYQTVAPGTHTIRPLKTYDCEPGFYCPSLNSARRRKCPVGFKCPGTKTITPTACSTGTFYETTCSMEGLTAEAPCPRGFICNEPTSIIPVPPGYSVKNNNRRQLHQCKLGEFCSLGTGSETETGVALDTLCPIGTNCPSPSVLAPLNCSTTTSANGTLYCSAGTFGEDPCPAGFECPTPITRVPCADGFYCPAGTRTARVCPAGFYCNQPDSITECPYGFYCIEGSTAPTKCQYLVICGARTSKPYYAFGAILLDVALVVVVGIGFVIVKLIQRDIRKKREKKRAAKEKAKLLSTSAAFSAGSNIAAALLNNDGPQQYTLDKKKFTMDIEMVDLSFIRKKNEKVVFHGLNGKFKKGKTTCIITDEPGVGKALIQTLSGRAWEGLIDGAIHVNGAKEDISHFSNIIGYVPEDPVLQSEFKVKETLRFAAHQRLPSTTTFWQVNRKVQQVLNVFNLEDYADIQVARLKKHGFDSVQRKLVNIAVEVVAEPTTLFLENPISNLDTINARRVLRVCKDISDSGVTVIALVTKPSYEIFKMFDDCVLVASKAGVIFNGPTHTALQYFDEIGFKIPNLVNPVEFFIDICQGNVSRANDLSFKPDKLAHYWEIKKQERNKPWAEGYDPHFADAQVNVHSQSLLVNDEFSSYVAPQVVDANLAILEKEKEKEKKRQGMGAIGQYFLLTVRSLLEHVYHIKGWIFDIMFTFILASAIGAFFFNLEFVGPMSAVLQQRCPPFVTDKCALPRKDNVPVLMLVTAAALAITAVYTSVKPFGAYKSVYKRESASIYKISYFFGKLTAHLPYIILLPFIFLSAWYLLVAPRVNIFVYYGIFLLLWLVWSGFGYWISIAVHRQHVMFFSIMVIIACSLISGFQPTAKFLESNWYTWPLAALSPMRWAAELLYIVELKSYEADGINIQTAFENYGFVDAHIGAAVGVLLTYAILFRILSFIALVMADPLVKEKLRTVFRIFLRKGKKRLKALKESRKKNKAKFKDPTGKVRSQSTRMGAAPVPVPEVAAEQN